MKDCVNCFSIVFNIELVAHILDLTIDGQGFAMADITPPVMTIVSFILYCYSFSIVFLQSLSFEEEKTRHYNDSQHAN